MSDENQPGYTLVQLSLRNGVDKDEVWIAFSDGLTDGFDNGWDVNKLFSTEAHPQLYIEENNYKLSIDALPPLTENEKIILQIPYSSHQKAGSMGFYIICLADCHGLFSFFSIKSGGQCTILSSAFPRQKQTIPYLVYLEAVSQFHSCFYGSVYDCGL